MPEYMQDHHGIEDCCSNLPMPYGIGNFTGFMDDSSSGKCHTCFLDDHEYKWNDHEMVTSDKTSHDGDLGQFVRDGIEYFAKVTDHMECSCNPSINDICGSGKDDDYTCRNVLFLEYVEINDEGDEKNSHE